MAQRKETLEWGMNRLHPHKREKQLSVIATPHKKRLAYFIQDAAITLMILQALRPFWEI